DDRRWPSPRTRCDPFPVGLTMTRLPFHLGACAPGETIDLFSSACTTILAGPGAVEILSASRARRPRPSPPRIIGTAPFDCPRPLAGPPGRHDRGSDRPVG